jgi:hypothetical protein
MFFTAGYFGFLFIQLLDLSFPLELLTGTVFLAGASFVFLVMKLTNVTIREYRESRVQVSEVNEVLVGT